MEKHFAAAEDFEHLRVGLPAGELNDVGEARFSGTGDHRLPLRPLAYEHRPADHALAMQLTHDLDEIFDVLRRHEAARVDQVDVTGRALTRGGLWRKFDAVGHDLHPSCCHTPSLHERIGRALTDGDDLRVRNAIEHRLRQADQPAEPIAHPLPIAATRHVVDRRHHPLPREQAGQPHRRERGIRLRVDDVVAVREDMEERRQHESQHRSKRAARRVCDSWAAVQVPHAVDHLFVGALPLPHREPCHRMAPANEFPREQRIPHLPATHGIRHRHFADDQDLHGNVHMLIGSEPPT